MEEYDQEYYSQHYANKYNDINLEPKGIYLTEHNGFAIPSVQKGVFNTELKGGGIRTYSNPQEKQIKITVMVDNKYISYTDYYLYQVFQIFYTEEPRPLILQERPDRFIDCILTGAVSVGDQPGFTKLDMTMLAPLPYFRSIDQFTYPEGLIVMEGNAPHYPEFVIRGPAVDPKITVQNDWGTFTVQYTGSLGVADVLIIDSLSRLARFNTTSVASRMKGFLVCSPGLNTISINSGNLEVKCRWFYY